MKLQVPNSLLAKNRDCHQFAKYLDCDGHDEVPRHQIGGLLLHAPTRENLHHTNRYCRRFVQRSSRDLLYLFQQFFPGDRDKLFHLPMLDRSGLSAKALLAGLHLTNVIQLGFQWYVKVLIQLLDLLAASLQMAAELILQYFYLDQQQLH